MNKKTKFWINNVVVPIAVCVGLLLVWQVWSLAVDNPKALPLPWDVIKATAELFTLGAFYKAFFVTLLRTVITFALSVGLALLLSFVAKMHPTVAKIVAPIVSILRSVPTMSVILLITLTVSADIVPVVVSFLVAFPVCYSSFASKLGSLGELDEMCTVFDVPKRVIANSVYVPSLLDKTVDEVRATLPLVIKVVISGEAMVLQSNPNPTVPIDIRGIGVAMFKSKQGGAVATLFAWTLFAVVICLVIELVASVLKRRLQCKYN